MLGNHIAPDIMKAVWKIADYFFKRDVCLVGKNIVL
jgi:hypothetical protein